MQISNNQNNQSETDSSDYDVVIVGGGPAGSTAATLLTRWGRRVLVLEKERFPRHHIGESLLAGTTTLLKQIGVYDKVEQAGFIHKYGATYIWGKSQAPWSIFFSEVSSEDRYSFQVDRGTFDKILLDHSREAGAEVKEECCVTRFIHEGERIVGVTYLDQDQVSHDVSCRFCIDASGQSALIGTTQKWRKFNQTLRNFALYTYFKGGKSSVELLSELKEKDKGNIFVVAMDKGWIWYIPLSGGRHSVGIVTHTSVAKELNKGSRLKFYLDCLQSTPQIAYLLSEAEMETSNLYSQSDWSYVCDSFKGPGYLLVGDAACFVDPILSTGVDLAMEGAFKAAITINTALAEPQLADGAMQWYEEEYKIKANHFLQMAEHWYYGHRNQDDWFWKARGLVDPVANLSVRQAFVLLTGGFTTGMGDQDLPALKSFGGFRPFQLRTIYTNLDNALMSDTTSDLAKQSTKNMVAQTSQPVIKNVEESQLLLRKDMSYQQSMLEQDTQLVPVVRIVQDVEGIPVIRLVLPLVSLPLLERMHSKQTVQKIISEAVADCIEKQEPTTYEQMLLIVQELCKQQIVELAPFAL